MDMWILHWVLAIPQTEMDGEGLDKWWYLFKHYLLLDLVLCLGEPEDI